MTNSRTNEGLLYAIGVFEYFRARCGKSSCFTVDEWTCIQQWREAGLPLDRVLKGIDLAFSVNRGEVGSLLQCANAVREVSNSPS